MEVLGGIEMSTRSGKGRSSLSVEEQHQDLSSSDHRNVAKDDWVMASMGKKQQMDVCLCERRARLLSCSD